MELATYKGEHIAQAAGLVKYVKIPEKWEYSDITLSKCNKGEVLSYSLVIVVVIYTCICPGILNIICTFKVICPAAL
jgi:hypothetical protein